MIAWNGFGVCWAGGIMNWPAGESAHRAMCAFDAKMDALNTAIARHRAKSIEGVITQRCQLANTCDGIYAAREEGRVAFLDQSDAMIYAILDVVEADAGIDRETFAGHLFTNNDGMNPHHIREQWAAGKRGAADG